MNRLASSRSPYLRAAAHQPIDWHPWGPEAFEKARREDKPILLDVGAVWCHWCHVMDGESYESPAVARLVNSRFVPVKVDRDERPDVDTRYQKAVGALTGQGGWPLTAFLTPDGEVFYGGTYFPPDDRYGRPGFPRVLEAIADAFSGRRGEVMEQARAISEALAGRAAPRGGGGGAVLSEALLEEAVASMEHGFDARNGGWGAAPKFPHPCAVTFLLRRHERAPKALLEQMTATTLERMGKGGVYDQVGGGFHRYSVDAEWVVPHFEKMLYDNAELLRNYVHAAAAWGRDFERGKASDVHRFLTTVLADRSRGGWGGSQDADSAVHEKMQAASKEGRQAEFQRYLGDGDYFTWTLAQLREALDGDPELARILALHFDVKERGEMHHDPSRNVLFVAAEPEDIAAATGRPVAEVRGAIARGLDLLRAARERREAPFVDPVVYTGWNAMAASAVLEFAAVLGREDAREFALRTIDRLLAEAYADGRGFSHVAGEARYGLLDDNAQMLPALLEAFNAAQEPDYLVLAKDVADLLLAEFAAEGGGFVDVAPRLHEADGVAALRRPERPAQDNPSPSANARAIEGLLRLGPLTGDARYPAAAREALEALAPEARRAGLFAGALFHAADLLLHPAPHVLVAGREGDPTARALHEAALRAYGPGKTILRVEPGAQAGGHAPAEAVAFLEGPAKDRAAALVCLGDRCLAPAFTPEELAERLMEARRA